MGPSIIIGEEGVRVRVRVCVRACDISFFYHFYKYDITLLGVRSGAIVSLAPSICTCQLPFVVLSLSRSAPWRWEELPHAPHTCY